MDFTYCRTWAGLAYVAFIVEVFAQKSVAWHCATSKDVDLVITPLRMAAWQRQREGCPVVRPSIGTVGDAYDDALMESVIGLFF